MAIDHQNEAVQEVRLSGGRHDAVEHKSDIQIAGILRDDNERLIASLDEFYTPIPWSTLNREGEFPLPSDATFNFLGKDLTSHVNKVWNHFRMSEERLTMRQRFSRALGVYDWVIHNRPKAVVVWTDEYPECRAAVMAGNDLKIPTIELVHGAFHPYFHGNFSVKSFAKWKLGSWEYREWAKFHNIDTTVIPTGITSMDAWPRTNMSVARPIARKGLRIPDTSPVICFLEDAAFERNPWNEQSFTDHVRDSVLWAYKMLESMIPDLHLIVKLHPYDSDHTPQTYRGILDKAGITSNYTIIDDGLAASLAASDLAVGLRSTAMVYGLLVGLPSVPMDARPFFEGWAYRGFGFAPVGSGPDLLSQLAQLLTSKEKMGDLIGETSKGGAWFGTDGTATMRAYRAIMGLMNGKEPDELCYSPIPQ